MRVLLLHGFTSSRETISGLIPRLEKAGIEYALPTLRGHFSRPEDLLGVTWRDWLEDARDALLELSSDGGRVVIVGLSMGGLVALNLAAEHRPRVAGVATVAAVLRFRSRLIHLLPVLRRLYTWWPGQPDYADPALAKLDNNYRKFPIESLASLKRYTRVVEDLMPRVVAPLCVVASRKDPVVADEAAEFIIENAASAHKEVHWFERSRHEMMRDVERDEVFDKLTQFIARVQSGELEVSEPLAHKQSR